MAAHRPEEALGPLEPAKFLGAEQPALDHVFGPIDLEQMVRDPVERVEVAQAALAVLHVGLDQIAAVPAAHVPRIALGQFGGDECLARTCHDLLSEVRVGGVEQRRVAPDPPRFEHCGADAHVGFGQRDQFVGGAHRMADLQLQIPQSIECRLDQWPRRRGILGPHQEHQVDVAKRRHFAAPGPAQPDQCDSGNDPLRHSAADPRRRRVERQPHQLVGQESIRRRRHPPARWLGFEAPRNLGATGGKGFGQGRASFVRRSGDPIGDRPPVDNRPPLGDQLKPRDWHQSCSAAIRFSE